MALMVFGLFLWSFVHLFKRLSPNRYMLVRDRIGENGVKGVTTLLLLVSLLCITFGYKTAPNISVYYPEMWLFHLNYMVMAIVLFLLISSFTNGKTKEKIRHPMLVATILWGVAHLMANGDLASIILFAAIAGWADAEIMAINVREGPRKNVPVGNWKNDIVSLAMTAPVFIIVTILHGYIGPSPIPW